MLTGLRGLWHSVAFRLALNYAVLATATVLALLSILYIQTVGTLRQASERQIGLMMQNMETQFAVGGREAVANAVAQAMGDGKDSENEIYLLLDEHGQALVGNLAERPAGLMAQAPAREYAIGRTGPGSSSQLLMRELPDQSLLVVGRDLHDEQRMENLLGQATTAAGLTALLMVMVGTYLFRRALDQKISAIRQTTARVGAGGITERVAQPGHPEHDDEFGRLNRDINQMLDRMEGLMDGVRHVSNTIAHNLRTPLTRILDRLRHAQREDASPQERVETIASTLHGLEDLNIVFEKLLRIAEAESGARRQGFVAVRLDTVAADVVDLYAAVAEDQDARLSLVFSEPVEVLGDPDLLAGAVANLVDNALKYAGAGGEIRLDVRRDGAQAVLHVRDNGPGIAPQHRARVGIRFYRPDATLPGYGLGLSSVFATIRLHGGSHALADALPNPARPGLAVRVVLPLHTS